MAFMSERERPLIMPMLQAGLAVSLTRISLVSGESIASSGRLTMGVGG